MHPLIIGGTAIRTNPDGLVSLNDMMDLEQLTRTSLAEIVARKRIERFNARGNQACAYECDRAAAGVAAIN